MLLTGLALGTGLTGSGSAWVAVSGLELGVGATGLEAVSFLTWEMNSFVTCPVPATLSQNFARGLDLQLITQTILFTL